MIKGKPVNIISKDEFVDKLWDMLLKGTGVPKSFIINDNPLTHHEFVVLNAIKASLNNNSGNYYRYLGYYDGSGCPAGIVIKYLTPEECLNRIYAGERYKLIKKEGE